MQIKQLNPNDLNEFVELVRLFADVFETPNFVLPTEKHLLNLLTKKDFCVFVAIVEGNVVGGITAYLLEQYYTNVPLAFIYDLAVQPTMQRKGIGKLLITHLNNWCAANGCQEAFVLAEADDTQAIDFYHSTRAIATQVVNFNYVLSS